MKVERIGSSLAGQVTGIDVASGTSPDIRAFIEDALVQFPVLCLPGQRISDAAQADFVHIFGPAFEAPHSAISRAGETSARLLDVANVEQDGAAIAKGSAKARFLDANLFWHTDGSYSQRPIRLSALSARTLPSTPPDTEYADMRAAWDALPPATRRRCEGLVVEHSLFYSRRLMGLDEGEFTNAVRATFGTPARHPLVRSHPVSGRKSLYLSSHAGGSVGWRDADARDFLDELTQHATQARFVYAHKWQPHDLMMWDDSCTMHRATPYDGAEPRMLRWASVLEPERVAA
jgi:alpha-ketoglutarate-dependent 2,4-dichlorophenoxyacetate dioxygenase